tara:strand:- start:6738 stop:7265 length:528 start_codon:yes stop_codon:yes gene_type:complete
MCIDPGVAGTGVSIWHTTSFNSTSEKIKEKNLFIPLFHRSFKLKDELKFYYYFLELAQEYEVERVYIENAHYHGTGSAKGQMTAAKGDLVVLAKYIGGLLATFWLSGVQAETIDVMRWKGQLPKEVVMRRILKIWPECPSKRNLETGMPTAHDWDAIGIGYYLMGLINKKSSGKR